MGSVRVLFVMAACLLLFCGELLAQVGYTARTAEYMTATSDLVVKAVVADLKFEKIIPEDDKYGSENFRLVTIFLDVKRCLKGNTDNCVKLQVELPVGGSQLDEWLDTRAELFWFLNVASPDDHGIVKIVPHRDLWFFAAVVEPPDPHSEQPPLMLLNVDFEPLTSNEMIERTVADFHRRFGSETIGGTKIPVDREITARTGRSGDANACLMPANYLQLQSK